MKVLWLCNNAPGAVRSALSGKPESPVNWLDSVLDGLRRRGITLRILYRGGGAPGQIDTLCSYAPVPETPAEIYQPKLEEAFRQELRTFRPDVIHSWGVEYHHALAMADAGMLCLECGHFATEEPGIFALADALQMRLNAPLPYRCS